MSTYGDLLDNDVSQEKCGKMWLYEEASAWKLFPVMPVFSKQLKGQRKNTQKVYALMMLKGT
jgi:hypothetical protein